MVLNCSILSLLNINIYQLHIEACHVALVVMCKRNIFDFLHIKLFLRYMQSVEKGFLKQCLALVKVSSLKKCGIFLKLLSCLSS